MQLELNSTMFYQTSGILCNVRAVPFYRSEITTERSGALIYICIKIKKRRSKTHFYFFKRNVRFRNTTELLVKNLFTFFPFLCDTLKLYDISRGYIILPSILVLEIIIYIKKKREREKRKKRLLKYYKFS